jgi:UDP-glucose 4-epimerase
MRSLDGARVLVTGADGFIGSHLAERLVQEGAKVRAFCFYNIHGSWGWLDESEPQIQRELDVVLGDIRDESFVRTACQDIEIIFHLAAMISIPFSYVAPATFVDTNVRGTLNILEAARAARCERVIQTSTSEVYGTPDSIPIREDHPLKGQSPYSATKIAADKLSEAYALSFETPVVILRPFNTYGPRQSARAVLPTILSQLIAGKTAVTLGSLETRRDFTYVADTVDGFVKAATADVEPGEVIQLGTGKAYSIREVLDLACAALGTTATVEFEPERVRPAKSEVQVLQSDPTLAERRLGWKPSTPLQTGIKLTADWFRTTTRAPRADTYSV